MADVWGIRIREAVESELHWRLPRSHFQLGQAIDGDLFAPPNAPAAPWGPVAETLLRRLRGRSADDGWFELDSWGNGFLQLESGGTVILGPQTGTRACVACVTNADRRRNARGMTMPRPISLGEVLAWKPLRRLGIALPAAASYGISPPPRDRSASMAGDRTVLSASEDERFVLTHGDNYGHLECRGVDGSWQVTETVAEYMPAGAGRRYLRRVGEAYGEFQRRRGNDWESECSMGARRQRLYLIDSRFEMLTDAEYERRCRSTLTPSPASCGS